MVVSLEAPPVYPYHVDYVFAKYGQYLTMFHSVDGEPPPLRAIGLNMVEKVNHFG